MTVSAQLAMDFKTVAKSMIFHAKHDKLANHPHHHARRTLEVKNQISNEEFAHALGVHKAAGSAKHLVGTKARVAMSDGAKFKAAQSIQSKTHWDDKWDEEDDSSTLGVAGGGGHATKDELSFAAQVLPSFMSAHASEFVPAFPLSDGAVPSIGTQLDFFAYVFVLPATSVSAFGW